MHRGFASPQQCPTTTRASHAFRTCYTQEAETEVAVFLNTRSPPTCTSLPRASTGEGERRSSSILFNKIFCHTFDAPVYLRVARTGLTLGWTSRPYMQVGTILHEHEKARDPTYGAPGHTDLHAVSYREPPAEAATFAETQIADRAQSSSRVRAACALSKFARENFRAAPHRVCYDSRSKRHVFWKAAVSAKSF